MQSKLAMWSMEDKERKFDRLLRLIADRNWLSEAARITLASSGARTPGVDGVDKRMMEATLQDELATIREEPSPFTCAMPFAVAAPVVRPQIC